MASEEVNRLRAQYKKTRANVTKKIARIRRETGAKIAGSEFDPRANLGHEKKLNATQLRVGIEKMQQFQSRNNQFVGLVRGKPAPRHTYSPLKNKGEKRNELAKGFISQFENVVFDPESGRSVKLVQAQFGADGYTVGPFDTVDYSPEKITSISALKRLEASIDKQLRPDYFQSKLSLHRQQAKTAMEYNGEDPETIAMIDGLSDFQFAVLWYGSEFAEETFLKYETLQTIAAGRSPKERMRERAEHGTEVRDLLVQATKLPRERVEKAG